MQHMRIEDMPDTSNGKLQEARVLEERAAELIFRALDLRKAAEQQPPLCPECGFEATGSVVTLGSGPSAATYHYDCWRAVERRETIGR